MDQSRWAPRRPHSRTVSEQRLLGAVAPRTDDPDPRGAVALRCATDGVIAALARSLGQLVRGIERTLLPIRHEHGDPTVKAIVKLVRISIDVTAARVEPEESRAQHDTLRG